jgi:hypothetical protein
MEASPTEVRIEHSVVDQRALARGFTVLYALIAAAGLVAVLFKPELLLGAVFFALFVAWWAWRIRRAQSDEPWLVVLTPAELRHSTAGVDVRIARAEAGEVRLESRAGPRMRLYLLKVRDPGGGELLVVSLPGKNESTMLEAGFEEWGWPITGARG